MLVLDGSLAHVLGFDSQRWGDNQLHHRFDFVGEPGIQKERHIFSLQNLGPSPLKGSRASSPEQRKCNADIHQSGIVDESSR